MSAVSSAQSRVHTPASGRSSYSGWSKEGGNLYHVQIDHDTSEIAQIGVVAVCGVVGIAIGVVVGGSYGAVIGGAVGIVLGAIAQGAGVLLQDEEGCVWWWTSLAFLDWLSENIWWLGLLAVRAQNYRSRMK